MTGHFYCEKFRRTRKELIIIAKNLKWPGTFIIEKFRTAKSSPNESKKKRKELKMTGHFYCEKFRRTRKELTNESENDRSLLLWKVPSDSEEKPGTFIMVKSSVGLARNL